MIPLSASDLDSEFGVGGLLEDHAADAAAPPHSSQMPSAMSLSAISRPCSPSASNQHESQHHLTSFCSSTCLPQCGMGSDGIDHQDELNMFSIRSFFGLYAKDLLMYVDWLENNGLSGMRHLHQLTVEERHSLYNAMQPHLPYSAKLRIERLLALDKDQSAPGTETRATQTYFKKIVPAIRTPMTHSSTQCTPHSFEIEKAPRINTSLLISASFDNDDIADEELPLFGSSALCPDSRKFASPSPSPDRLEESQMVLSSGNTDIAASSFSSICGDQGSGGSTTRLVSLDDIINTCSNPPMLMSGCAVGEDVDSAGATDDTSERASFQCPACSQTFSRKDSLTIHYRSHTGETPFPCVVPGCDLRFRSKIAMNRHQIAHTAEKNFACDMCSKKFKTLAGVRKHRKVHLEQKLFTCDICQRGFRRKDNLQVHQLTHSAERRYGCLECGKRYRQRSGLAAHVRKHQAQRP